ncbi:MAG TPA: hypothetical protein VLQ80_05965 [Candidatus Saccharimonadia bacterium]|nr:hypothetical protein [Candidatus Saccharimonadia bacterium]
MLRCLGVLSGEVAPSIDGSASTPREAQSHRAVAGEALGQPYDQAQRHQQALPDW